MVAEDLSRHRSPAAGRLVEHALSERRSVNSPLQTQLRSEPRIAELLVLR